MATSPPSITRNDLIGRGMRRLEAENIGDSRRNVEWMLCELLKCDRASLYAYPEAHVASSVVEAFEAMIQRRLRREPLQHILGYTSFCGVRIEVSSHVLIPRPETEQLFEKVGRLLKESPNARVLDICTGSGCLGIAINHFYPAASVFACDISPEALHLAAANARTNQTSVEFFQCDILAADETLPSGAPFDVILSNPPYIPSHEMASLEPEVRDFEPGIALDAGPDPLRFYRAIVVKALRWLTPGGALLFETHCDYAGEVADLLGSAGFSGVVVDRDLAGLPRIVSGWRI